MNKIVVELSDEGIDKAIKKIEQYQRKIIKQAKSFGKRVAEEIGQNAEVRFSSSIVNDLKSGGSEMVDADITVTGRNGKYVVTARGKDVAFVEFGAGVYHNGTAGSSPHERGVELGMTIGSYGKGLGKSKSWGFYANEGDKTSLVITRGTPATMPMYRATQDIKQDLLRIAREVFR